jgi:hypothetical protein
MSEPVPPERAAPEPAPDRPDPTMTAAIRGVAIAGLAIGALGFAASGVQAGLSALVGGAIATANLYVFVRIVGAFLAREGRTAPWAVITILKLTLLFGGVWVLLKSGLVSALWLAGGYAALPVGITFGTLFGPKPR